MPDLPTGTVTFLFTDIEGSTRLWEDAEQPMRTAMVRHDEIVDGIVEQCHGVNVSPRGEGDSRFIVFPDATDAVTAAIDLQRGLQAETWDLPRPIKVRIALHTGIADMRGGDYYGGAVNRSARLRSLAYGGQTVISGSTFTLVQDTLPAGLTLRDMGLHGLKDLTRPEQVYQVNAEGLADEFPPLKSLDAVRHNLPTQLTDLIGREREVAELAEFLRNERLITILAPGGTGKTRIALDVAAEASDSFPDGVFLVPQADQPQTSRPRQTPRVPSKVPREPRPPTSSTQSRVQQHGDAGHDRTVRPTPCPLQARLRGVVGDSLVPCWGAWGAKAPQIRNDRTLRANEDTSRPRLTTFAGTAPARSAIE